MFSVTQINEQGFHKVVLGDQRNATTVEILPAWGAMLHYFGTRLGSGELINVIDSYADAADIAANLTGKGFRSSKLSPFVCRLREGKYDFEGGAYAIDKCMLGDHAIHGLLYDKAFSILSTGADESSAWVTMEYAYRGEERGFPFHYDCQVTYVLKAGNELSVQTRLINATTGRIPVQDGWHPYFKLGGSISEQVLQFNAAAMVAFDEGLIPTGELLPYDHFDKPCKIGDSFLDNCFVLRQQAGPACVLCNESNGVQIAIYAKENYPYLQVYTPPHRTSIAIENLSGAPDGYNNGMGVTVLEASESARFETIYKLTIK